MTVQSDQSRPKLDPERIRLRSPIKEDAVDRVLAEAGLPPSYPETEAEAVRLTLMWLAELIMPFEIHSETILKAQREKIAAGFRDLFYAMNDVVFTRDAPPPMPLEWGNQMVTWIERVIVTQPQPQHRPESTHDRTVYTLLLSFYFLAFERRPGKSISGPAPRFLKAFFVEVNTALNGATWNSPAVGKQPRPDLTKLFEPPGPDALLLNITKYVDEAMSPTSLGVVEAMFEGISAELANRNVVH